MDSGIKAPVIAGLATGIAFIFAFAILSGDFGNEQTNKDSMIKSAESLSVTKAFLSKYPDAVMNIETQENSQGLHFTGIPAVSFTKTAIVVRYHNKTTGTYIDDVNNQISNKSGLNASNYYINQYTSSTSLYVHLDSVSHHPDKISVYCYGQMLGTGLMLDYREQSQMATKIENAMVQFIDKYPCLPSR